MPNPTPSASASIRIPEYRQPIVMPRIRLRPLEPADAERLAALVSTGLFGLDDTMATFDPPTWVAQKLNEELLPLCHVMEAGDTVVGYVQVAVLKGPEHHYLSLGGWVARRHWGKGYSDDAIAGVQQVLRQLQLPALYARMHRANRPAHRAVARAGFVPWPTPPAPPEPDFIWYRWH